VPDRGELELHQLAVADPAGQELLADAAEHLRVAELREHEPERVDDGDRPVPVEDEPRFSVGLHAFVTVRCHTRHAFNATLAAGRRSGYLDPPKRPRPKRTCATGAR